VHGYRVRYVTSAKLLEELTAASGDKTLSSKVRYYSRFDLLIIDEFGFDKLERREYPESPSLLYKVIDSRSRRGSTAIVTNVEFKEWTDYLGDPPLVMAMLDRLVDDTAGPPESIVFFGICGTPTPRAPSWGRRPLAGTQTGNSLWSVITGRTEVGTHMLTRSNPTHGRARRFK